MEPDYISCQRSGISVSVLLDVGTIFIKEMAGRDIYLFGKTPAQPVRSNLCWWLPLPVLNLRRTEVEEEIVSRWMNFCVLIRVVLCMQGWCGRLLSWCMVWGTPDAEKNIALAADLYKKRVMALIGKDKSEDSSYFTYRDSQDWKKVNKIKW